MSLTTEQQQPADPRDTDSLAAASSLRLLLRARRGDLSAREALIARYFPWLRRWARGRLPDWARAGVDTSDLVQDALLQTFRRIAYFESQRDGAFRAYLRLAVDNRIRDEMRRIARRSRVDPSETTDLLVDGGPSPLEQFITDETWARYLQGLQRLTPRERRLIVGRAEMGYSYKQLALIDGQRWGTATSSSRSSMAEPVPTRHAWRCVGRCCGSATKCRAPEGICCLPSRTPSRLTELEHETLPRPSSSCGQRPSGNVQPRNQADRVLPI